MKVLVFPALLAVAIITTPPKPFARAETAKAVTTRATVQNVQSAPLTNQTNQADKTLDAASRAESEYTARR